MGKIFKYTEFIRENNDTPETYIKSKLNQLKVLIDGVFGEDGKLGQMGVKLDNSEISLYSQTDDSLTVKYSDDEGVYNLYISINIKNSLPKEGEDFSEDDIKKIWVKFKKYSVEDIDLIGQTTHNIDIERKDRDFIFKKGEDEMDIIEFLEFLKSDFEDKYGNGNEFKIEK